MFVMPVSIRTFILEFSVFTTNIEDKNGQFVFMRAPSSNNHHDVAFFSIGRHSSPSSAGQKSVGLYHIAWELETLAELEEMIKYS